MNPMCQVSASSFSSQKAACETLTVPLEIYRLLVPSQHKKSPIFLLTVVHLKVINAYFEKMSQNFHVSLALLD